jgi:subtilisin family serine protease
MNKLPSLPASSFHKYFLAALCFLSLAMHAQKAKNYPNWQLRDPSADRVYGTGVEKAYVLLKGRPAKTIIVAVIDGGTDINHEDLKSVIWTNPGEIPDNGIDDDHNGYVDDVHGWNFLGGKNANIQNESTEMARLYHKYKLKYNTTDSSRINAGQKSEYREYLAIKSKFEAEQMQLFSELMVMSQVKGFIEKIKKTHHDLLSRRAVRKFKAADEQEKQMKKYLKLVLLFGGSAGLEKDVNTELKELANTAKYNLLNTDSIRRAVVGDDPYQVSDRNYGNNNVSAPDVLHATHVSGIIAAIRNNNIGINGIADHVQIMIIRAIPDGDERDKDVANAIRYAVDNHASIINMSFGKYYSPNKAIVDEAIKYAADHDVLIIHASGNESKNEDLQHSYPTNILNSGITTTNWIEVGASDRKKGKNLIGPFSNYGQKHVDLFAPGVNIYSTGPDNTYINESGTSMAAPVTTGVAALIREYFPELKASEVKEILMKTVTPYSKKLKVPGQPKSKETLSELCVSGGIVNAYNAVRFLLKK